MTTAVLPRRRVPAQAAAAATPLASDERWDPLIATVVAYTFVSVGRIHQLFPALEILRPAMLTAGGALMLTVLDRSRARRIGPVVHYSTVRCLLAFLLWGIVSIPGALYPGGAFETVFDHLAKALVMGVVSIIAVRGKLDVHRLAVAFFMSVALYACVILLRFQVDDSGRLSRLYYYDANDYALLAVISMPLGAYAVAFVRNYIMRGLCAVGLVAIAVTFVWTGSRGGFLALGLTTIFGLFMLRTVPIRWRLGGVAALVVGLMMAASDGYWERMGALEDVGSDYNVTSESGRLKIWQRGITYMFDYPVFGVGAGNFATAEGTISPHAYLRQYNIGVKWSAAHNSFVQVGAELGFPGLLLFVGALASSFFALRRAGSPKRTQDRSLRVLANLCSVSFVGFVVGSAFLSLAYHDFLYALHGLAMSLVKASLFEARA